MGVSNNQLLMAIIFAYHLASGVSATIVSHFIRKNGGNQLILGVLFSTVTVCNTISRDFLTLVEGDKKFLLVLSLYCCLFSNLLAIALPVWPISCLARAFDALTSQVLPISKEIVSLNEPEDTKIRVCNLLIVIRIIGLSCGCIIGGYTYQYTKKFSTNSFVGCSLVIFSILLAHNIEHNTESEIQKSHLSTIPKRCIQRLKKLFSINYRENFNVIRLKIFYTATVTIFYSRFTFVAGYNYRIKSISVGYIKAFRYLFTYASGLLTPFMLRNIPKKHLCEYCMICAAVTLIGLYYAPHYRCYIFFFIGVMFLYGVANLLLEEDALHLEEDEDLKEAIKTISFIISVSEPTLYGIVLHFFGGNVFKIIAWIPAVCYCVVLHKMIWEPSWRTTKKKKERKPNNTSP